MAEGIAMNSGGEGKGDNEEKLQGEDKAFRFLWGRWELESEHREPQRKKLNAFQERGRKSQE